MNYYPHHIGDYLRDTAHLTTMEDGLYRRMLDVYYASEKPLPLDPSWIARLVRARTEEELSAVGEVLRQFFVKYVDGWHNKRADSEIKKGRARVKASKTNGKRGGRPITQRVSKNNPAGYKTNNPDQSSPKAKSQKPNIKSIVGPSPDVAPQAASVLAYLNEQASRDYKPVNGNLGFIAARLREGASVEDCKAVIDRKCREWKGGEMEKYLRPATLFNATKFAQYQGEKPPAPTGEVI